VPIEIALEDVLLSSIGGVRYSRVALHCIGGLPLEQKSGAGVGVDGTMEGYEAGGAESRDPQLPSAAQLLQQRQHVGILGDHGEQAEDGAKLVGVQGCASIASLNFLHTKKRSTRKNLAFELFVCAVSVFSLLYLTCNSRHLSLC
jgi:hypothetical protein